jgi:hypothetical protein
MAKFDWKVAFADGDPEKGGYKLYRDTWMANGHNEPLGEKVTFEDMIATPNARQWLPKVIEDVVREPVEPMLIIPGLLDRVQYEPGVRITFPAIGALVAFDLAEGQAYPEQQLNIAPGTMTVTVGKSGLAFKISEEMRRYSQFDVINLHLRAARRALDRHKEKKGMNYISGLGVTLFDNRTPTQSVYGTCTGRALDGTGNGSCRMEDLLKAYSFIMMQGFTPDTLLLHPLTWSMWMADPLLQTIVKNTGNGQWFQRHNLPLSGRPWDAAGQAGLGKSSARSFTPGGNAATETATTLDEIDQNLNSAPVIPDYFPHPLRVLISPFVPYDPDKNVADIMLFDSTNLGALIVDEDVTMQEWEDMSVDIMKVKLRERYTFGIYHDGLAIGVLRNIPVVPNEIALPLQATIGSSGSIAVLDPTVAISGL